MLGFASDLDGQPRCLRDSMDMNSSGLERGQIVEFPQRRQDLSMRFVVLYLCQKTHTVPF